MRLIMRNINTTLSNGTLDERAWLKKYLTFVDESKGFVSTRRGHGRAKRVKPPQVTLFDEIFDTFPSGLVNHIMRRAEIDGISCDLIDDCGPIHVANRYADLSYLREYQREAVEAVIRCRRGILSLPTGAGKGVIAIALTSALPIPWLYIVHRRSIADQMAQRYDDRVLDFPRAFSGLESMPKAKLWSLKDPVPGDRFTVATFRGLLSAIGTPQLKELTCSIKGVIVDECHTASAETHEKVLSHIDVPYRIGLSGTPLARLDKRSLVAVGALGPVIYHLPSDILIKEGCLARPIIKMVRVDQPWINKPTYQGVYGEAVVRSYTRNNAIVEIAKVAAKPALLFVKEISHGRRLKELLEKAGLNVNFIYGQSMQSVRASTIQGLRRGDLDVGIASVVWQEGVDIPELRSAINGAGGKSVIATLQRLGRVMRPVEGKDYFFFWDIDDGQTSMIGKHTKARWQAYKKEGHEVKFLNMSDLSKISPT